MRRDVFLRLAFAAVLAVAGCFTVWADAPKVQVSVVLESVTSDTVILAPGESSPSNLNVPLRAVFTAELLADDGKEYVMFPQWTVTRTYGSGDSPVTDDYLKRQESVTEYEFTDYGQFQVSFAWSYREKDATQTIPGEEIQPMTFTIDDSDVNLPYNGFSPNDDDINDVYKIYVQSVVSIKIVIFNRWGQTIKTISGSIESLMSDAEPSGSGFLLDVWDGKYNGSTVNDGVYYINVHAVGASGREFEEKGDINVLKGVGVQQ